MSKRAETRLLSARAAWVFAAGLGLCLAGCTAAIGAGVVAAGLTVSAIALSCDDTIRVTVWDRASGNAVCDAVVTAVDKDGDQESFSPCYGSYLGEGTWTVTATRPGHHPATSTVIVSDEEGCRPALHTVELTPMPISAAGAGAPLEPVPIAPPAGGGATPPGAVAPTGPAGPGPAAPPPAGSSPAGPPPAGPPPAPATAPNPPPAAPPAPPASAAPPPLPSPPTGAFPPAPAAPPTR